MFPNIILITHNKIIAFHSKKIETTSLYKFNLIDNLKKILKIENQDSGIIILNQNYEHCITVINAIKKIKLKKIYFFIDDVFRIKHKIQNIDMMETHTIEKDFENTIFCELEIIKKILEKTKINNFQIFHCEHIPNNILKKFPYEIKYFDIFLNNWIYWKKYQSSDKTSNIDFKLSCFNHRRDWHRYLISALLHEEKDVILTSANKYDLDLLLNNPYIDINSYSEPFKSFFLSKIKKFSLEPQSYVNSQGNLITLKNDLQMLDSNEQNASVIFDLIKKSFVNLVTETRFHTPLQYLSEKTLKPMIVHRPFIILSSPHTLKLLKEIGFKTFDKWWDESYDDEVDHSIRFKMVYDLSMKIINTDKENLIQILKEMTPILEHNFSLIDQVPNYFFKKLIV